MIRKIFLLAALSLLNNCITWGGSNVQMSELAKSKPTQDKIDFCVTKMGIAKMTPELILAIKEGGKNSGVELIQQESCAKETKLTIHISSYNNDKSNSKYYLELLSAATLGVFPFVPSWSEVNVIMQWKHNKEPIVIQNYYAKEKILGSFWFTTLWWRTAYPNKLGTEVLRQGTEHFVSTMNTKQDLIYKNVKTKSGKVYYMVRIEKNPSGETLKDFYGNKINLGTEIIDQKQILDQKISF